jgi:hypothetical protein
VPATEDDYKKAKILLYMPDCVEASPTPEMDAVYADIPDYVDDSTN